MKPPRLFTSSIGRKALMALTGLLLVFFLMGHAAGNMLVWGGQEAINNYAQWLHDRPGLLWVARIGLLAIFGLHVYLGISLQLENRAARPVGYALAASVQLRFAARSMLWTGLLVLAYVVYHLLHFTLGVVQPYGHTLRENGRADVFGMVLHGFQNPLVTASYVVAMALLGLHLYHAILSFFQTMGFNHPRYTPVIEKLGRGFSVLIVLVYLSIPLGVIAGLIRGT